FFQAEDGIRDLIVTGVQTCALPIFVRFFSFASSSNRVAAAGNLKFGGTATRLGQALDRARDELAGLPLAGLVMVSDGADTSDARSEERRVGKEGGSWRAEGGAGE